MKKTERRIREESKDFYPDNRVKESIKEELGISKAKASKARESKPRKFRLKPILITAMACALVLAIAIPSGLRVASNNSESYVSMDINPSFEFVLGKDDTVKEVRAMNKEAVIVLEGLDLVGLPMTTAQNAIIDVAIATDYIDEMATNNAIKIVAISDKEEKEKQLQKELKNGAQEYLSSKSVDCEVLGRTTNATYEEAKALGVSLGKLELINQAMEKHPEFTFDETRKMSVKVLNEIIANYDGFVIEQTRKELQYEISHKVQEAQTEYQELKKTKESLEKLVERIEESAEKGNNFQKLQKDIEEFNTLYSEYAYTNPIDNLKDIENYFDRVGDEIEDLLEIKLDAAKDKLNEVKKGLKDKFDKDDDDEDKDDDDKLSDLEKELMQKLDELDFEEDALEDMIDKIKKDLFKKPTEELKSEIEEFNAKYPKYAFSGDVSDFGAIKDHISKAKEEIKNEIKKAEKETKDKLKEAERERELQEKENDDNDDDKDDHFDESFDESDHEDNSFDDSSDDSIDDND